MHLGQLLGFVVVLAAAAFGLPWVLKRMRMTPPSATSHARVVQTIGVGPRERIVVLEVAGKWIVAGVGQQNINALAVLDKPDAHASGDTQSAAADAADAADATTACDIEPALAARAKSSAFAQAFAKTPSGQVAASFATLFEKFKHGRA